MDQRELSGAKLQARSTEVSDPVNFNDQPSEKPSPPETSPAKTVWSTMTTRIETETSIKRWSTPVVKTEEGQPPGPEDHPSTKEGRAREGNVKTITPNYKLGSEKPSHDLKLGSTGYLPNEKGDYKVSMRHEDYKLTVIDPKVRSNANMPLHSQTLPDAKKQMADDFPSQHSKRSLIKLEPLEQRRFKSVESRPITTSNYLTESVERHREMEASRLRDYLKAKESDANKPWNKPGWPGPKKNDDESLRELEHIKKSIETLQKTANQPPKNEDLDFLARKNEELLERSRERRAGYKLIDSEIVKEGPEPVPQAFKDQVRDLLESRNSVDTTTRRDHDGSGYVTDDKPRGIMKRRELETRDQMMYPAGNQVVGHRQYQRSQSNVSTKPSVTETVQRFEETRRTEEVMRRVQRKERRERRSRHHSSSHHHNGREAWENGYHTGGRSNSASRGQNGFLPSTESYSRQTTTRRENDHSSNREDEHFGRGLAHARYGSLSDSLRRGELKYVPNGEVRETHWREGGGGRSVHKSNSTRDVFGDAFDRSGSSYRRGSHHGSPVVEFPPTLPRRSDRDFYRPVSKSRSYADWDDAGRAGFGREVRRHDDDMSRLEAEFRDSLLMPLPRAGNMNEREYATEQIPGGFEKYEKENRINSGRRIGRHGQPVDFSDASQEYSYKREQELEHRR